MTMIRLAMQNQLGVDAANSHYDIATSSINNNNTNNSRTSAANGINGVDVTMNGNSTAAQGGDLDVAEDVAEDGMYL